MDTPPTLSQQPLYGVKVLHSIERPGLTPVFGTTVPPAGLSGRLRRLGYRFSENDLRHWAILMLADRVDVAEGLLSDLAEGRMPHLLREMGVRAEWRHNRGPLVQRTLLVAALAAAVWYLARDRRRH